MGLIVWGNGMVLVLSNFISVHPYIFCTHYLVLSLENIIQVSSVTFYPLENTIERVRVRKIIAAQIGDILPKKNA